MQGEAGAHLEFMVGSYEYINMMTSKGIEERRYIMDLVFTSKFVVAQAEKSYVEVVVTLS